MEPEKKDGSPHAKGEQTGAEPNANRKKKEKKIPPNVVIPNKKPKLTKAERRALQEAQRAAKDSGSVNEKKEDGGMKRGEVGRGTSVGGPSKLLTGRDNVGNRSDYAGDLFSHLPQYKDPMRDPKEFSGVKQGPKRELALDSDPNGDHYLHPAIVSLGEQYASYDILGANSRCKAMLRTFQVVLSDYVPPPDIKDLRHDLENRILKPAFQYWTSRCRAHSVTMGNAFSFFKLAVANLDRDVTADEARRTLSKIIDSYVQERIDLAVEAISKHASSKIRDGDVILTYARSDVVEVLLVDAALSHKRFRVICVDSRPLLEGRTLVERLSRAGIECTYILLNSLSYVMKEVTKVFLGAAALMCDGAVLSRVGTSAVALMAQSNNVPVLFCCETYKISNRVQLESITSNELGNPQGIVSTGCISVHCDIDTGVDVDEKDTLNESGSVLWDWQEVPNLRLLPLLYDLTPSELLSGIVTEMGILPPTSVAVLLREMNPQDNDSAFKSDI